MDDVRRNKKDLPKGATMADMTVQSVRQEGRSGAALSVLLGLTLLGLMFLLWLALSFGTTTFWTSNNISNLLRQGAMIAILAVGETFTIITGGIDLSVGAVAGFVSMTVALLLANHFGFASSVAGAVAISLAIGVLIGMFHAFGIVQMGLPPFIMTLATMYALRGIGFLITNGATISIDNDAFTGFSRATFLGFPWTDGTWFAIPMLFWMALVVAAASFILLTKYRWGRYLRGHRREQGGGGSLRHQRYGDDLSGLHHIGLLRRLRRVLLAMRIGIGNPGSGRRVGNCRRSPRRSSAAPACSAGSARCRGPVIGSFILTTFNNGANLLNLNPFWQRIFTGALIIIVVYFDTLRRKRR